MFWMKNKNFKNVGLGLVFVLMGIYLSSCRNELDKKIEGVWVIDQAYYHDNAVVWNLYSNGLILKNDYSCDLPISNANDRNTEKENGIWSISEKDGNKCLVIETSNELFCRTYRIDKLERVQDKVSLGLLLKMTLVADSLKLDCTKAIYK